MNDFKTININDLIAICHIMDKYENLNMEIKKIMNIKGNKMLSFKLSKINNNICFGKIRKFYINNKEAIDIFNKYSNFTTFIFHSYDLNDYDTDYFYNYILNNNNNLNNIMEVLYKLKSLGFIIIYMNENYYFDNTTYTIFKNLNDNNSIEYLDNIEALPSYLEKKVKYKTNGSNYRISLNNKFHIKSYKESIELNSLVFDPSILPEKLDKENTFDKIINLNKKLENENENLRNSININISIEDLIIQYQIASKMIEKINNDSYKVLLKNNLENIKNNLEELKTISDNYSKEIINNYSLINDETINEEKKLCLQQRNKN